MRFDQDRRDQVSVRSIADFAPQPTRVGKAVKLRRDLVLAAGLALLGLALRLSGLADKAFWYDEILTWGRARLPLGELVINALRHKHFPSYFLLVGPFASAANNNPEWMLRLPSAVFGAACVFLVARLAYDARGVWAGLVAGLLMALSPIEVAFAQDARPYTLISCCVLIAAWGLLHIAQNPQAASLRLRKSGALAGAWIAYVLGTLAALLIENNTIPFLLASNLALAAIVLRARRPIRPALIRNWAWSQAFIVPIWLPALLVMAWINRGAELDGMQWIAQPTWDSIKATAQALYLFRISDMMSLTLLPSPLTGFGPLVAAAALFGAWRLKADPNVLAVIGLAFVSMPLFVLAVADIQPLLIPRYLLWSTGPFFVLAGIGTAALPRRWRAGAAATFALGGAISLAPYYSAETKPRWREALTYLAQNMRGDDVLVAQNEAVKVYLLAYADRFGIHPRLPIVTWGPGQPHDGERAALADKGAWIVYGRVGQGPQESESEFRNRWTDFGAPAEQIRFGSSILISRFDHVPPQRLAEPVE